MIKRLKPKSEFRRNVLTLMTGTTIAQAIPIAITPILTRLYTPEDFGILALFVAVTAILGSIANGRYELAIMLPEKDEDAINVAALGLLIALCFSVVLLIPAIFLNAQITNLLGNQEIGFWLYFVPFVVLMTGLFNVLNYLNTRKKLYKDIAKANVYKATAMAPVQLGVGFIKTGATGLITGQILSQVVANYRLAKNTQQNYDLSQVKKTEIKQLAKRYIKFPKYSMWAGLVNTSAFHVTSILISGVYSVKTLGFYFLTQRALGMPASLISGAIGQVFFQQASAEKIETGTARKTFTSTLKKLIVISFMVYFLLYWVVKDIFVFVFGDNWALAGDYAKILIPLFFIQFFVSPLTTMNVIFDKNEVGMYWQFTLLFLQTLLIGLAYYFEMSIELYLQTMVLVIGAHYLAILAIVSTYNGKKDV